MHRVIIYHYLKDISITECFFYRGKAITEPTYSKYFSHTKISFHIKWNWMKSKLDWIEDIPNILCMKWDFKYRVRKAHIFVYKLIEFQSEDVKQLHISDHNSSHNSTAFVSLHLSMKARNSISLAHSLNWSPCSNRVRVVESE